MQWILDNWLLVLLVGGMIVMHLGHGMHGGKGTPKADEDAGHKKEPQNDLETRPAPAATRHIGK